jgi:hypothetical protein
MITKESLKMKERVNPDNLERWLIKNPDKVYKRSVETAISLSKNKDLLEESFMEFVWENETYSKIYMKRSDIPKAMDKAIEYFVKYELYEYAQMAKEAKELYEKS